MTAPLSRTQCFVAVALLLAALVSPAGGGTIGFDPPAITIDRTVDEPIFELDVYVAETSLFAFDAFNIVVGSDDGLEVIDFRFAGFVWCDWGPCAYPIGVFQSDLFFTHFGLPARVEGDLLGTLTVNTEGLPSGTYMLVVDHFRDGGMSTLASGTQIDYLTGSTTVTIIPEPSTQQLLLLLIPVAALVARRSSMGAR
jgi:hypothetical protein